MFKTKSNQNENRKLTQKLQIAQNKNSLDYFFSSNCVVRFDSQFGIGKSNQTKLNHLRALSVFF